MCELCSLYLNYTSQTYHWAEGRVRLLVDEGLMHLTAQDENINGALCKTFIRKHSKNAKIIVRCDVIMSMYLTS